MRFLHLTRLKQSILYKEIRLSNSQGHLLWLVSPVTPSSTTDLNTFCK